MNAQEFSECMFFYKSPAVTIGERVFKPLRSLCAKSIEGTLEYDNEEVAHDLYSIMDIVKESVIN